MILLKYIWGTEETGRVGRSCQGKWNALCLYKVPADCIINSNGDKCNGDKKCSSLSHLKGIWVTDILINKVPVSQHQVCSLHNFSLLEWMEIRCPLPQWFLVEWHILGTGDSSQEEPYMGNDELSHFRSKKIQRKELQKAGWGQWIHKTQRMVTNPWVSQNIQTWKQVSGWEV